MIYMFDKEDYLTVFLEHKYKRALKKAKQVDNLIILDTYACISIDDHTQGNIIDKLCENTHFIGSVIDGNRIIGLFCRVNVDLEQMNLRWIKNGMHNKYKLPEKYRNDSYDYFIKQHKRGNL